MKPKIGDMREEALAGLEALLAKKLTDPEWRQIHAALVTHENSLPHEIVEVLGRWWTDPPTKTPYLRARGQKPSRARFENTHLPPVETYEIINRIVHSLRIDGTINKSAGPGKPTSTSEEAKNESA